MPVPGLRNRPPVHRNPAAGEPMAAAGGFEQRQDGIVAPGLPLLLLSQQFLLRRREQADECVNQNTTLRVATCFHPIVEANYQPSEAQGIQLPIRVKKAGESCTVLRPPGVPGQTQLTHIRGPSEPRGPVGA